MKHCITEVKWVVNDILLHCDVSRWGERDGQWFGRGDGGVGRASGQAGESGDGGHPGAAGGSHGGRQQRGGGSSSTQHAQLFTPERRQSHRAHPQLDWNQYHPSLRQRGKHVRLGLKHRPFLSYLHLCFHYHLSPKHPFLSLAKTDLMTQRL